MPLRGEHHKTYEPGTHYSQASGSAVFPYLKVTKAATPSGRFGVPQNLATKRGTGLSSGPLSLRAPNAQERSIYAQHSTR
jgi:hypothetical protein